MNKHVSKLTWRLVIIKIYVLSTYIEIWDDLTCFSDLYREMMMIKHALLTCIEK